MLKLFYITNNPKIALLAQNAGVDRIFIDMEYIGKDKRQGGLDTVKNHHTVDDVKNVRRVLDKSKLLVRVNPIHENSQNEIDEVVSAGADYIMLPMWKTPGEVKRFLDIVNGRAKTMLLLETDEARLCLDDVLEFDGIDEVHIGLNDLSLSQKKKFLFQLVTDGTVDEIAKKLNEKNIPFGFGGVGKVGSNNLLPAKNILAEHYRLGSSMVILSRSFCDLRYNTDEEQIKKIFNNGIKELREYENKLAVCDAHFFEINKIETQKYINKIVDR